MTESQTWKDALGEGPHDEDSEKLNESEAQEALDALREHLAALKEEELRKPRLSGAQASAYATRMDAKLKEALPALRATFVSVPEKQFALLRKAALAFWSAQRAVELLDPNSIAAQEKYEEAGVLKEYVIQVLRVVGFGDKKVEEVIEKVKPGTGYVDRANDLQDLSRAVETYKATILQKELLTPAQITSLQSMAEALLAPTQSESVSEEARLERDRAWTFFLDIQAEADRHMQFLYAKDPKKREALPVLHKRARKAPAPKTP
ncbi:hypothetical protein L6R29_13910 [Myxococcota bacterium]|nr:hypothetical protein [Myxococcota bacterium]